MFGGSLGEVYGEKIVKVQELAVKTGRPLIGINDGRVRAFRKASSRWACTAGFSATTSWPPASSRRSR
ncbi:carboxyl transferase domain protein [Mycobacterium kansasii]|uniref:Carboxyl transferase domain protein n=1 Tax=Mycobacterium kansasii TaxID=1768 RepID=A0A1V3WAN9_MYCKA|nr:carboxyl transferase domain protein [Mycobacterium kansasii]